MAHPCRSCGACCAFFRVEFYWREAGDAPDAVPIELVEEAGPHKMRMKGTNQKKALRCIALEGQIGREVGCKIYHQRATPCHEFSASYENGEHNPRCDQARRGHGLAPLQPEDWGRAASIPPGPPELSFP
jgi:Fe-S-cluster containining protein